MRSTKSLLSNDLAAIVHHVELNRAGWWDRAVQRLVLASVWLLGRPASRVEILSAIENEFHLTALGELKLNAAIEILEKQNALIRFPGPTPTFRIPDQQRTVFEKEIAAVETVARDARSYFSDLVKELCEGLDPNETWKVFESKLLAPLIQEVGANAYRLIAGEKLAADERFVREFLDHFESHLETSLNQLVTRFLDPNKEEVRKYVSCMLHAVFCVTASGLPENVITRLSASSDKQITFRVFVDTNFLFSILALHDNPSNVAATELNNLIATLKTNSKVKVNLFVTLRTIDEAKHSIFWAKTQLTEMPSGSNFTGAALQAGFSGMVKKFLEERIRKGVGLSVEDWFDPYLNDFVTIARSKGVELFNKSLDGYKMRPDVIDDINVVIEKQESNHARAKNYEKIEHDMVLWHFVKDERPDYVESPIDAQDWILTLDYRLIRFDANKQKETGSSVPICVHPTSLIQLLQFWVPRTKEFEEAILGSMRLPFLFREFDTEAEHTSLRILKGISRFEESDHFTEETISKVILNDALRAKIGSVEEEKDKAKLIRDTILEEINNQNETVSKRAQDLEDTLKTREKTVSDLKFETKDKKREIELLKDTVSIEGQKLQDAGKTIQVRDQEIKNMKNKERAQGLRLARYRYLAFLIVGILISYSLAWWLPDQLSRPPHIIEIPATRILVAIAMFLLCHRGLEWKVGREDPLNELWFYRQMSQFRVWLWSSVFLAFFISVLAALFSNEIQQFIDQQALPATQSPAETERE